MTTIVDGGFEWDAEKAAANLKKHGVSFEEAATIFADPAVLIVDDGSDSGRYIAIGLSLTTRVLSVAHVERGSRDRIISARVATAAEERNYAAQEG